jgi:pimeloyl-ACP methyl ester carboxylesterase
VLPTSEGRRVKKLIASAAAAAGVALAGLAISPIAAQAADSGKVQPTRTKGIHWHACAGGLGQAGAVCGYLSVPLDYAHPHGKHIQLAVSMVRHTSKHYQGIMLTNPGGPGGSGLSLSTLGSAVPSGAGAGYDWIGFDPRGIGSSKPELLCNPNFYDGTPRPNYRPGDKATLASWLKRTRAYTADCRKNDKIGLLAHDKTTDSVADMESIRKAFGQKQINYYGFSYGTYLGQVYASLHPKAVRRMVLDSNVDPRGVWYQSNLDQDTAFNKNLNLWFNWVAQYNKVFHLGSTPKAVHDNFYGEFNKLIKHPVVGSPDGGKTKLKLGEDEFTDVFLQAGYYRTTWTDSAYGPGLGGTLADLVNKGDATKFAVLYSANIGTSSDNGFVGYNAVQCTDVSWPGLAKTLRDNWAIDKKAPFETWDNAWFNAPCMYWPAKPGKPVHVNGKKVAPILLIDETNDAATPYEGSVYVRGLFPKSSLVAEPNGNHAGTHADSLSGDMCVDGTVATYLATGKLPKRTGKAGYGADKVCAPLPDPNPTASSAQSRTADQVPGRVHFSTAAEERVHF